MNEISDPYSLLQAYAAQSKRRLNQIPPLKQQQLLFAGASFSCGDHQLIINLQSITEIYPLKDLTPIPWTKNWIKGLQAVRGKVVTVIDLPLFLGFNELLSLQDQNLIIAQHSDLNIGFLVENFAGIERFYHDAQTITPTNTPAELQAYCQQGWQYHDQKWLELDLTRVIDHPHFYQIKVTG